MHLQIRYLMSQFLMIVHVVEKYFPSDLDLIGNHLKASEGKRISFYVFPCFQTKNFILKANLYCQYVIYVIPSEEPTSAVGCDSVDTTGPDTVAG